MASRQAVKTLKKSSIPGVTITQFVDDIPEGCSTPDFERKPITLTLQEGKNAIFRAVVKGVPTPDVKWKRTKGGMDDSAKYETSFNAVTNEFILQINKLTEDDTDLYRCSAVNEYGEAVCTAGLRIIQVGFKRKAKQVPIHPADELKKKLQDFRKLLRKRAPQPPPKPVDKEAIWQLLLHADKRDYERICLKYGISDFRGMLRKLQEIKKDTETEHGKLMHSMRNKQHIRINKEGKATFSLEMDLKNSNSNIYLLKDGERVRYGTGDEYRKHCLRQVGKRYNFIVNDVQPEDAGLYQVRVEDVPVFSTELEAESIPVRFKHPLSDVHCPEEENAVFECTLRTPCYDAVWLHKTHLLEASEKHQISVTPDGLTHQLIIKNILPSDSGMYTLDTGLCSSNACLIVEHAKGKRRQNEGGERDKAGWIKGPLSDKDRAKKLRRGEYLGGQDHFMDISMEEDGLYRNGQEGSQGYSIDDDGRRRFLGQEGLDGTHRSGRMGFGQFSRAEIDGDSTTSGGSSSRLTGVRDTSGLGSFHGEDSMISRADIGDGLRGAGGWYSVDGRGDARSGFRSMEGSEALHGKGAVFEDTSAGTGARVGEAGNKKFLYGKEGLVVGTEASLGGKGGMGSLYQEEGMMRTNGSSSAGVGGMYSLSDRDAILGGASPGTGQRAEEIMGSFHGTNATRSGSGGVGGRDSHDGKDGMLDVLNTDMDDAQGVGSWHDKDGKLGDTSSRHGFGGVKRSGATDGNSVLDGLNPDSTSVGSLQSPYGKDDLYSETSPGTGAGRNAAGTEIARRIRSPYGKDGMPTIADINEASINRGEIGTPYGKDDLRVEASGPAGQGGRTGLLYGPDGLPAGAAVGDATAVKIGGFYGGFGSPYGKDGLPAEAGVDVASVGGVGCVGSPYGKDGLPAGTGVGGAGVAGAGGLTGVGGAGVAGAGGFGSPYGKDGLPAEAGVDGASIGGLGCVGTPYGKDGLPAGTAVDVASVGGVGGVGTPYGKDGPPGGAGVGVAGVAGAGGFGSPYGKDGLPAGAGVDGASVAGAGVGGVGGVGSPYGKDGLPAGAGVGGVGGVGTPYGKDGLPAGTGVGGTGVAGAGGFGSPYGKDGLPAGAGVDVASVAGAGLGGLRGVGSPFGKDGLPAGAGVGGAGVAGARGIGSPYGKDSLPAGTGVDVGSIGGLGDAGTLYGKDGFPSGTGVGGPGVGGIGSPYGKDGLPGGMAAGTGASGAGVAGAGGAVSSYGKGGLLSGAGVGIAGTGAGGVGSSCGKDGLPAWAGVGIAGGAGVLGAGGVGTPYGKDGLPVGIGTGAGVDGTGVGGLGGVGSPYGKDGLPAGTVVAVGGVGVEGGGVVGASAIQAAGSPYGKEGVSAGSRAGAGGVGRFGSDERELHSFRGREGVVGAVGLGGESGLDSHPGKFSMRDKAGTGAHSDFRGSGRRGSTDDRDSLSGQGSARGEDRDLGQLGSYYRKDSSFGGAGSKSHNRSADGRKSGVLGEGSLAYDQMSGLDGGLSSINRRKQMPGLDINAKEYLKNTDSMEKRRCFPKDDLKAPRCHVNKPLVDVRVLKGEPAELSCTVSNDEVKGTWFKDGLKLKSMDGVLFEKEGSVHKLIINKVEDIHAGKYKFEAAEIKTEASIFVEDPPQVDKVLLKNLTNVPTVAKAGQKIKIKIPFEGQLPIRATWLKDRMELVDDTRIRVDKADTFTMLSISSSERKDCGDYKVRLKNDHGVLEINLKLVVIDKPQQPTGPIRVVESSPGDITIHWKPPKDDGGKPVQSYIVERQQAGKQDWVTLGETPKSCTTFTTNKVEQDMSYYFRVRAVNAEGTSDALESDEVKAVCKASPGPPDPPEIISASKGTITISWKAPRKTGSSRIVGYIVQKREKGTNTWVPVTNVPVADRKLKMTNLKMGLQYEFRVAAVNAAGVGEASAPSQPVFAQDSTKPPGQVRDLRVASSDSTSITLTWRKPEPKGGVDVKGYEVEMRSYDNLKWTKCSALPIKATTYTVKGLQTKELYFLRVRALNDSGLGEAAELETFIEAALPVVPPRFLIDDRVKSFLIIKAGNTIRVPIPFEASPDPVVTWLKDGLPLPKRATINTEHGTTQLLIEAAEFSDSGTYTVELQNGSGNKETFSFQVQVTDIPQSPGPIELEENVPNTVTVTWKPSASEKWESNLYYTVLKCESQKGLWHVVGDLIYTNKFTFTKLIPGRDYYFRVVAKNYLGASGPSETVQPWRLRKEKAEFQVKQPEYRGVNQTQPPRFLVQLKPHVVTTGTECHMSCAVAGHPPPKITWYKDGRDVSKDPTYLCTNVFGVCSLMILDVAKNDEGEYMVEATNKLGRAFSKAFLTIKDSSL
ncbi:immunoglobulin-like and fibronectin type III domain-containing protein 1 [Apteryx rowi]|uniref:immunoglobulin-like and fibronectin type III domain-containing protein 1 n=1 Tax=Apteryx rowi TaxID=308060 RepID=UPI000E1CA743|nr:immunoglobulin-like and fibronectin type III domain-containing protein 1 [Apteryx rowi]